MASTKSEEVSFCEISNNPAKMPLAMAELVKGHSMQTSDSASGSKWDCYAKVENRWQGAARWLTPFYVMFLGVDFPLGRSGPD